MNPLRGGFRSAGGASFQKVALVQNMKNCFRSRVGVGAPKKTPAETSKKPVARSPAMRDYQKESCGLGLQTVAAKWKQNPPVIVTGGREYKGGGSKLKGGTCLVQSARRTAFA
jgi:hypothetical protein